MYRLTVTYISLLVGDIVVELNAAEERLSLHLRNIGAWDSHAEELGDGFSYFRSRFDNLRNTAERGLHGVDYLEHSPLWAAVSDRDLDTMKTLWPFSGVNACEYEASRVLTPLAEAARQGFYEGIEYLIGFEEVDIDSVNSCLDDRTKKIVLKTSLDLALDNGHTECVELLERHGALKWRELPPPV
jgi:hypothetical protein